MLNRHLKIQSICFGLVVEEPADVMFAVFEGDVWDGAGAEGHAPGYDSFFDYWGHWGGFAEGHFDVGTGCEEGGGHVLVVGGALLEDPGAYAAFSVVVAAAEYWVKVSFLIAKDIKDQSSSEVMIASWRSRFGGTYP